MISRINAFLGLALMATPFVLGVSASRSMLIGSLVLGALVAIVSGYKALTHDRRLWEDDLAMLAGIGMVMVPIIAGFGAATAIFWASTLIGCAVIALAGYEIYDARVPIRP